MFSFLWLYFHCCKQYAKYMEKEWERRAQPLFFVFINEFREFVSQKQLTVICEQLLHRGQDLRKQS